MQALAGYQRSLWKTPSLRWLFFELTDRCNLSCRHCGSGCSGKKDHFLDAGRVMKVLEEVSGACDAREVMICLTGGEPLLHPALTEIIRSARELGFPVGITTNGTLIDETMADQLAEAGLLTAAVSLDGIGEAHDAFRGRKGAFSGAVRGLLALKKAGVQTQALTVVQKENLHQLEEIRSFLGGIGVDSWRLTNMDPIGRAKEQSRLLLDGRDLRDLFEFIREQRSGGEDPEYSMEVTYGCAHFAGDEFEHEIRDAYFQCGAGTRVASVMADGTIGACLDIERRADLAQGNVMQDDFLKVWEDRFEVFRRDRTQRSRGCGGCRYRAVCLGDAAHTWDFDRNEPRYCAVRLMEEACGDRGGGDERSQVGAGRRDGGQA